MDANVRLKVLCVDDEPQVVAGLSLHVRRNYQPLLATSGPAGLDMLQKNPGVAIIISDMRMPGMDGASFLAQARKSAPEAVRMLLTGQTDIESAIAAVNQGQIFRFLTKPCPPSTLLMSLDAAAEQHRLITAERVLLDQTLRGCVKVLGDVLALTSPLAFGCAMRIRQHAADIAGHLELHESWHLDVAAMLSQLGSISLPQETAEKAYNGRTLSADEAKMVARMPAVTQQLLGSVPRLEIILEILGSLDRPYRPPAAEAADPKHRFEIARIGGEVLKAAVDFDALETAGNTPGDAVATMKGRKGRYDPHVMVALEFVRGTGSGRTIVEIPVASLTVGMVLAEDVRTSDGILLSTRGFEVTHAFVERVRNNSHSLPPAIRVIDKAGRERAAS
jgi:response regulator RpfG family c-di-GMP phosphodiesterase